MATYSKVFEGGKGSIQGVVALGTGAVTTQTRVVGVVPKKLRVSGIRIYQQGDIAGTTPTLTAEVYARTTAGAAGNSLQSSTVNMDVADAAAGKAGQDASLTTTEANLDLAEGQLIEVVFTAGGTVSTGPGDVLVEIEFVPRA